MTLKEFRKLKYAGYVTDYNEHGYVKYYPPNDFDIYSFREIRPGDIFCKKEKEHYTYYIVANILSQYSEIKDARINKEYVLSKLVFNDNDKYDSYTIVNDTNENDLTLRDHKELRKTLDLRTKLNAIVPIEHYIVFTNCLKYKGNKKGRKCKK